MGKPLIPVPEDIGPDRSGDKVSFRVLAAAETTVIELFDDVFPWEAKRLLGEIRASKGKPIELRINSPGGDVFGGVAIYNALSRHDGAVNIEIEGVAASIASVIAMAGDQIRMGKGAFMMIHNPHAFAGGESSDLRATAELLDKVRSSMVGIYAGRTKLDAEKVIEMMDAETWLDADEAVELGFADSLNGQARMAARFDADRFKNAPPALLAASSEGMSEDAVRAALAAFDEAKLRRTASHIGTLLRPFAASAKADAPEQPEEPQPEEEQEEAQEPEASPPEGADSPKADDEAPEDPPADPLVAEAAAARIRRLLGKSDNGESGKDSDHE